MTTAWEAVWENTLSTFTIDADNHITANVSSAKDNQGNPAGLFYFESQAALAKISAPWPLSRLVELWNSIPGQPPVHKFQNRQIAVARLWNAVQPLAHNRPPGQSSRYCSLLERNREPHPLPIIQVLRPTALPGPFDHPEFLFEVKYDGFRSLAYVHGQTRLVSRQGRVFTNFTGLASKISRALGTDPVLDGEIACLDADGKPQFADLMWRRTEPCFCAFDLLWLDGKDLRDRPLLERKELLARIIPGNSPGLLYVRHVEQRGVELFEAACRMDLEGLVAKWRHGRYREGQPPWLKIKNPNYSQNAGRQELFRRRRQLAASAGRRPTARK